jgi:hypothetical protein
MDAQKPGFLDGGRSGIAVGNTDEVHVELTEAIPGNHVDDGKTTRATSDDGDIESLHSL